MIGSSDKIFLFLLMLLTSLSSIYSQSSALVSYSDKDVWVVFPDFCHEDYVRAPIGEMFIDTSSGFGINVDAIPPFALFPGVEYRNNPIFSLLPFTNQDVFGKESPFTHFTIQIEADSQFTFITTLSIGKIERWHEAPVLQKFYPLILNLILDSKFTEVEYIVIVSIYYEFKCRDPIYSNSVRVNFFKLYSDIDFLSLVEWSKGLRDNIEFYPINCVGFNLDSIKYMPCNLPE
jgi:hypothetical protein